MTHDEQLVLCWLNTRAEQWLIIFLFCTAYTLVIIIIKYFKSGHISPCEVRNRKWRSRRRVVLQILKQSIIILKVLVTCFMSLLTFTLEKRERNCVSMSVLIFTYLRHMKHTTNMWTSGRGVGPKCFCCYLGIYENAYF